MSFIKAGWNVPSNVVAGVSNRFGGHSIQPFTSLNMGDHVEDDRGNVELNRRLLANQLGVSDDAIQWLDQVHGTKVYRVNRQTRAKPPKADAAITATRGIVCAVMTADCLPILLCDKYGREVAAVHAGWRSLVSGVIENTVENFEAESNQLKAWLGPAIGPKAFEVGEDVREAFLNQELGHESMKAFKAIEDKPGKYHANLYRLAKLRLRALGIKDITGHAYCTVKESQWYSYRDEGQTGRMASFIMLR